jgi:DNA-binding GntR family transcriptional regulator
VGDREFFRHMDRMTRLSRAMNAPLDAWGADIVRRTRARDGDAVARAVRLHLHEAFIELVTTLDNGIRN